MVAAETKTGEAILEAAAALFAERGYRATTTRALAERAGVNEVTIFRRFKNKQGVLVALGEALARTSAGSAVAETPDPADTRATLEALADREVSQAKAYGAAVMRLALEATSDPEVAAVIGGGPRRNFAGLVAYLTERQAAGDLRTDLDPRVMAEAFFALTSIVVMSRRVLSDGAEYGLAADTASGQLFELFFSGVTSGEVAGSIEGGGVG